MAKSACDLVVHSLKDVPTTLPDGLAIVCVPPREDPTDSLVLAKRHSKLEACASESGFVSLLNALPAGSVVGTSSIRRAALLGRLAPHLTIKDVRGNLNSRIAKLDLPEDDHKAAGTQYYDALVLATAGLVRLGWQERISETFDSANFGYGVSQGALGLEMRSDMSTDAQKQLFGMLKAIQDPPSAARCAAERGLLRSLRGGCQVPLAVSSEVKTATDGVYLCLNASVLSLDGAEMVQGASKCIINLQACSPQLPALTPSLVETGLLVASGSNGAVDVHYIEQALALGDSLAKQLLESGAAKLLPGFDQDERPATYGSAELAGVPDRS